MSVCFNIRLDVSMEDAISVHVFYGFEELIHVELDAGLGQVRRSPLDGFIKVHLHEFENQS